MPTRDRYAEGVPCWVDLATTDLEGAKTFYGPLFGWDYSETPQDQVPYLMATKNGLTAAGIGLLTDGRTPPVWSTYFAVENANATARKITAAGGSLLMDCLDLPGAGRLTFSTDPMGAAFGIWQAREHIGAAIVNEPGSLTWNELNTANVQEAVGFYETVFGHTSQAMTRSSGAAYAFLLSGQRPVAAVNEAADEPSEWLVYFAVEDMEAALNVVESSGGTVLWGPKRAVTGILAELADSAGARFRVIQLASPKD